MSRLRLRRLIGRGRFCGTPVVVSCGFMAGMGGSARRIPCRRGMIPTRRRDELELRARQGRALDVYGDRNVDLTSDQATKRPPSPRGLSVIDAQDIEAVCDDLSVGFRVW